MRYSEKEPWVRGQDGHLSALVPIPLPAMCFGLLANKNDNEPVSLCFLLSLMCRA